MDLTQLKIFCLVAEGGSVTAAAERLHRVPSNISTRIKQLEAELNTALFIREKLRLKLSDSGHVFLDYARKILALADEARIATSGDEPGGRFKVGSLESTAAVRIPSLLASYHRKYEKVELDFTTGPSDEIFASLLDGKLTAAFIDGPVLHEAVEGIAVWQEKMVVVAAKHHPAITCAKDVAGAPIYAFRSVCSYRRLFENWFRAEQVSPGRIHEMESYHGMLACVSAGAGLALAPLSMLEHMPGSRNVSIWPLSGEFGQAQTWLVWRRGTHSANLNALKAMILKTESE